MGETIRAALPARMRQWMSERPGPFSFGLMCIGLNIPQGPIRHYVARTLQKFVDRGEVQLEEGAPCTIYTAILKIMKGEYTGPRYRFNHSWRRSTEAPKKKRILRAMRFISFGEPFSAADVQRTANSPERSYVDQLIRKLLKESYLIRIGVRVCPNGAGRESLYRVTDSSKFLIDLL